MTERHDGAVVGAEQGSLPATHLAANPGAAVGSVSAAETHLILQDRKGGYSMQRKSSETSGPMKRRKAPSLKKCPYCDRAFETRAGHVCLELLKVSEPAQ